MIISIIYYVALSKFVNSSFPQCNVHTCVQRGCLALHIFGWLSQTMRIRRNMKALITYTIDDSICSKMFYFLKYLLPFSRMP